jgi:hypothetical protein
MSGIGNYMGSGALLGAGIGDMFAQNPANAANPYLNQVGPMLGQTYSPYMQQGQWAGNQMQGQIGQLLKNPGGFINNIGSSYQASPAYAWQTQQATLGANNAAAAGGQAGSPAEQQSLAGTITGLANQNYQQYIQNAMGAYGMGMGAATNMYDTGEQAADQYGTNMGQSMMNQGNLAYAGAINQNQSLMGGLGGILGGAAGMFGGGGGGMFGGNYSANGSEARPSGSGAGGLLGWL